MRSITLIILHACITLAFAEELTANQHGIQQNLIDRAKSSPMHEDLDATTLAKSQAVTNVRPLAPMNRPLATMNRPLLPLTSGRAGFGWADSPATCRNNLRVAAGLTEELLAERYGAGLFDAASKKGELEAVKADAAAMKLAIAEVADLGPRFANPLTPDKYKKDLIDKILDKGTTNIFCKYLIDKKRIDILDDTLAAFENLYNKKTNVQDCKVTSASALSEEQLFTIAKIVQQKTGAKSVKIKEAIDESLIGGFIISFSGDEVDLSVRTGLEAVKLQLKTSVTFPKGDIDDLKKQFPEA